jgi:hypothetical protein
MLQPLPKPYSKIHLGHRLRDSLLLARRPHRPAQFHVVQQREWQAHLSEWVQLQVASLPLLVLLAWPRPLVQRLELPDLPLPATADY